MLWGTVLVMMLLGYDTPAEALENTWSAIQDGSPRSFLESTTPLCSSGMLRICDEYLEDLKTLSHEELGEIFASLRLEAAPGEIEHWDNIALLEMVMSSPEHHARLGESIMVIDSIQMADSTARAFLTVSIPDAGAQSIELELLASPLGWRLGGLEPIVDSILESVLDGP